jgi:hypothetical protein
MNVKHGRGVSPWSRVGELARHGEIIPTARTDAHVLGNARKLNFTELVRSAEGRTRGG